MDIRLIADSERDLWNRFVADYPTGDLLQSYEWGIVKSRGGDWEPFRIMAFDDGQPVATLSMLKRRIPGLSASVFYASRGPVGDLTNPDALASLLEVASETARRRSAILLKIDPPIPVEDGISEANLRSHGFRCVRRETGFGGIQPKCVMQLDLNKDVDVLMGECKPKTRYNIRLAEKKGVVVREGSGKNDLRVFYDLLVETAARDGFMIRALSYYRTLWEVLAPGGYARLFLADYQSQPVAGALCFYFGNRCWYAYGASSNSHREVMPNYLMQWRIIERAKSLGCGLYDFRGVSPRREPDPADRLQGLNRFKEGFNARFVEYIGEYDLPFSKTMYWVWAATSPSAIALQKRRARRRLTTAG